MKHEGRGGESIPGPEIVIISRAEVQGCGLALKLGWELFLRLWLSVEG